MTGIISSEVYSSLFKYAAGGLRGEEEVDTDPGADREVANDEI